MVFTLGQFAPVFSVGVCDEVSVALADGLAVPVLDARCVGAAGGWVARVWLLHTALIGAYQTVSAILVPLALGWFASCVFVGVWSNFRDDFTGRNEVWQAFAFEPGNAIIKGALAACLVGAAR